MASVRAAGSAKGVRSLRLKDQAPDCEIVINGPAYDLSDLIRGGIVVDVGCGQGKTKSAVDSGGGIWIGLEPFGGGANNVGASAEQLPFKSGSVDLVIMDSVLEHIPDVGSAFSETARILKPGAHFVGYAAFMECFHEISYSHLSFKALEHYANINDMSLLRISGGKRFGVDYHVQVSLHPLPTGPLRLLLASGLRSIFLVKSKLAYVGMRFKQRRPAAEARDLADLYFQIECLRQSNGFNFLIRKNDGADDIALVALQEDDVVAVAAR